MGAAAHSVVTLVFKMNPYFDEDSNNESVGFRNVNSAFVQANYTLPSLCGVTGSSSPVVNRLAVLPAVISTAKAVAHVLG